MHRQTVEQRLQQWIEVAPTRIFLRSDFAHLGSARQLSRALAVLQEANLIARAGHGLYVRTDEMPVETILLDARARLGPRSRRLITILGVTVAIGQRQPRLDRHALLDAKKLASAERVIQSCTIDQIRRQSLANIARWNGEGTWVSAHDEWRRLMEHGTDQDVIAVMTGTDERSNRLRQSAPYVGLVTPVSIEEVKHRYRR
jgi:hypothetical protein